MGIGLAERAQVKGGSDAGPHSQFTGRNYASTLITQEMTLAARGGRFDVLMTPKPKRNSVE